MSSDPFTTQGDAGLAVVVELSAAGFDDAEEVGRGGFGVVYRCVQEELDRAVAVKVLTAELDINRERFLREQRAMGRLTGHPNIVGVLEVGETRSGKPYLVMQYHRHGSLDTRIRRTGPLMFDEALRLGVKMAGALETAHRHNIVHRDVKPGNILYTAYGEPALTDFGIAHVAGAFTTASGTFTGSPAFTAPEIINGDPPSTASDVYGLGATLFCALTGHAAFERRQGEHVVAQFIRITSEPAPDLRETGVPADIAALIESAMSRTPADRPTAEEFGRHIQQLEARHGLAIDEMALGGGDEEHPRAPRSVSAIAGSHRTQGNLPTDLSTFIGRRSELTEVSSHLAASRLVTLTGVGGVGKTRLALRAASNARHDFTDGVWLAELGELGDESLLVDGVAAAVGLRDGSGRPLQDVLVEYLSSRCLLLVLDNCEHLIDGVAKLTETLLRACPQLRILATSREALGVAGESVLPLSPLECPDPDDDPTLGGLSGYDAVALFAERAAATVPDFVLTDANKAVVTRICARLDGLPLAIELAAARLRALSPEQILRRLNHRYTLLTRGSRGAPNRQQTLRWSVGWSYDLCTPAEQRLWARLSVFAGNFDLEAAEDICAGEPLPDDLLDLTSSLVDKSILIRTETATGIVRFRFLETLREYGREQIEDIGELLLLRRRHADWFQRLVHTAATEWVGPQQENWIHRLELELPNLREALEFRMSDGGDASLAMTAALSPWWVSRGQLGEGRRWLDRALAATPPQPSGQRFAALYYATLLAGLQGDPSAGTARADELASLIADVGDPAMHVLGDIAEGFTALFGGDLTRACAILDHAVGDCGDLTTRLSAMLILAWAHELRGDLDAAVDCNERALALTEEHGESVFRSYALWATGIARWRDGDPDVGVDLLIRGLTIAHKLNDRRTTASCIEALGWIAGDAGQTRRAVVMMAAAATLGQAVRSSVVVFPKLLEHEADCKRRAREILGEDDYESAEREGAAIGFDRGVDYAMETFGCQS